MSLIAAKMKSMPLLLKVMIAIILGIAFGIWMPLWGVRLFNTFNAIFSELLQFLIPLIIAGLVAPAIYEVGLKAGKMLLLTVALAYGGTCLSGLFSYGISTRLFPKLIGHGSLDLSGETASVAAPYFTLDIAPLFSVMTALALAFLLGLSLAYLEGHTALKRGLNEFRDVVTLAIKKCIIPLLPIYIFGLFMDMTAQGHVVYVLKNALYVIIAIFAMTLILILANFIIAGIVAKKNPFKALVTMLPAYFTALGTSSSAATIPVTYKQSIQTGVREETAGFVIPLCATINMQGSALKIVACAVALMLMQGITPDTGAFVHFIMMMGITMVAAPGVPGGAIMAALGILGSILGFSEIQQGMIITLYIAMDSFGTACNVTCDGAIAMIVDKVSARK